MGRRQIQTFNISFLDLLAGALGAVILLFIIVPKLDSESKSQLIALNKVNVEIEEIQDIMEQAKNSIPNEIYDKIKQELESLEIAVQELTQEIEVMERTLSKATDRIEELESQNEQQQDQIDSMQKDLEEMRQQIVKCEENMEKLEGEGRFAVITMSWETLGDDVDMHIVDPLGYEFYYQEPSHAGRLGKLTKDDTVGPGIEVWQIPTLDEGIYLIKANLFDSKSGQAPELEFWIYYRNGNKSIKKSLYRAKEKTLIASIQVDSEGNVSLY